LRAERCGVRIPIEARDFSLLQNVWTGSGAHPASVFSGYRFSFPRGKAAGGWRWPLTSIGYRS
jgi:hypothetical protein